MRLRLGQRRENRQIKEIIMKPRFQLAALAALIGLASLAGAAAQIDWWTVDGGGPLLCSGGNITMACAIGQPDAGELTGGGFTLSGGFWQRAAACLGDLDGDHDRDLDDLLLVLGNFGVGAAGDADGDGDTDLDDLLLVLGTFGTPC
jgi:hypothetical protein